MASARRPRLTWRKEPRATGLSTIGASRYPRGDELCFGGNGLAYDMLSWGITAFA